MRKHSRGLAIFFSFLPGAGHMYIGLLKQGIELMICFFLAIFLNSTLGIDMFSYLLPVIWFYNFFDILSKTSSEEPIEDEFVFLNFLSNQKQPIRNSNKLLGYLLIGLGVLLVFDKIIYESFDYQVREYFNTAIVSILLILGGVKLLLGSKKNL